MLFPYRPLTSVHCRTRHVRQLERQSSLQVTIIACICKTLPSAIAASFMQALLQGLLTAQHSSKYTILRLGGCEGRMSLRDKAACPKRAARYKGLDQVYEPWILRNLVVAISTMYSWQLVLFLPSIMPRVTMRLPCPA